MAVRFASFTVRVTANRAIGGEARGDLVRERNEARRAAPPTRLDRVGRFVFALTWMGAICLAASEAPGQTATARLGRLLSETPAAAASNLERQEVPARPSSSPPTAARRDEAVKRVAATQEAPTRPPTAPRPAPDAALSDSQELNPGPAATEELEVPEALESSGDAEGPSTWFDESPDTGMLMDESDDESWAMEGYELAPPARRRWYIDPFGIQRRAGELAFGGDDPVEEEELHPGRVGGRIPQIEFQFSPPDSRHVGRGSPMMGTSWRNRPMHADLLTGGLFMTELIRGRVEPQNGLLVGTRLGWDVSHYLGGEFRLAQADVGLVGRTDRADVRLYDVMFNYYPWGDSRIRPFTSLGVGVAQFSFADELGLPIDETTLTIPFGLGVKAMVRPNMAVRFEVIDNLALGSDVLRTMNNVSVTGGFEWRFGGRRRNYYPFLAAPRVW